MGTIDRLCSNCDCWDQPTGECRNEPPRMDSNGNGVWPLVNTTDWCAKFIVMKSDVARIVEVVE